MTTSTWNDHPTPAQMSPHGSYHPNYDGEDDNYNRPGKLGYQYDPDDKGNNYASDHGSMRNYDDDHQQGSPKHTSYHHDSSPSGYNGSENHAYNNHGMSNGGSVKGYGSGGSPHGSLKDFASDKGSGMRSKYGNGNGNGNSGHRRGSKHGGSLKDGHGDTKDKFGGSEYGDGGNRGSNGLPTHNYDSERESAGGISSMMESWRPGMSWIDRRTFCMGDSCAVPPDWENHPILRQVPTQDHQAYRQNRLEEWLSIAHKRNPNEKFGAYMWRASALANSELKQRKKQCFGDEYTNLVDKFVMRLFYGMKLRLERSESVILGVDEESFVLEILREECEELYKNGQLYADQRSIQYTPLIASEHSLIPSRPY